LTKKQRQRLSKNQSKTASTSSFGAATLTLGAQANGSDLQRGASPAAVPSQNALDVAPTSQRSISAIPIEQIETDDSTKSIPNVPFYPFSEKDIANHYITLRYQIITAMPEYRGLSVEELRVDDYREGRSCYKFVTES